MQVFRGDRRGVALFVVASALLACARSLPTRDCEGDVDCGPGQTCNAGTCRVGLQISFLSPAGGLVTRGKVEIQLQVSWGDPQEIELTVDDGLLAKVSSPFQYEWDTGNVSEGIHVLKARFADAGRTYESAPVDVRVDRTRPTVVSRVPEPGADNVWLRDPIIVNFSEAMQVSSASEANVGYASVGGIALAKSLHWSDDRKSLTVVPIDSSDPPATLSVSLPETLADEAGNAIVLPLEKWAWKAPVWQDIGIVDDSCVEGCRGGLHLAAGAGEALAAVSWTLVDSNYGGPPTGRTTSKVFRWIGKQWEELSQLPSSGAWPPSSIDMGISGRIAVAWVEESEAFLRVKVWDGEKSIDYPAITEGMVDDAERMFPEEAVVLDFRISQLVVRLSPQGNPLVVWPSSRYNSNGEIISSLFAFDWDGSQWVSLGVVNPGHEPTFSDAIETLDVSFDESGRPIILWSSRFIYTNPPGATPPGISIPYGNVARWSGTKWNVETREAPEAEAIAVGPGSNRLAMLEVVQGYVERQKIPSVLTVDYWDPTGWRSDLGSKNLLTDPSAYIGSPSLGFWPDGTLVVAWWENQSSTQISRMKYWNGMSWELLDYMTDDCWFRGSLALSKTDRSVAFPCQPEGNPGYAIGVRRHNH